MSNNAGKWEWWHFIVAGLLIGAYGGYEIYSSQISKGIGSEMLAVLCVVIGLFSWKAKNKSRDEQR